MKKICMLTSVTLGGWFGWSLGQGFGPMPAYLLSLVGSLAGVYLAVRLNRNLPG